MTRAAKILYFGALLAGLTIGVFFSFRNTSDILESSYDLQRLTAPWVLRDFSYLEYKYADLEHANAALLTYASLLEGLEKTNPEKGQKGELAFAYTRLALLEDVANNSEQSQVYMLKAHFWSRSSGARDAPDSVMKLAVNRMDVWMQ
jgi:hypothetical protein